MTKPTPNRGRGRPKKASRDKKQEYLDVRLDIAEKQAFHDAAAACGLALSAWVRERLRRAAIRELEQLGRPIPFLDSLTLDGDVRK